MVVYFSWSGNTEAVAEAIVQQTGADVFRIQPETPYTDDYDALLDIAKEEQAEGARPAISGRLENLEQYDVVFLGFPNWWGDMPMILYTFLDEYDLSGKTIAPFVTSGGSGFSGTINAIESAEPDAAITGGLSLGSSEAREPEQAVADWLQGLESGESGIKVMTNYDKGDEKMAAKIIVQSEQGQVTYELNGSAAASSLRGQLPLSLAVEDFSTNEKIFYPTQALDTTDSPLAKGGAGTLAYYAPWGDAVMFYGDFRENPDLFELGTATERADIISKMSGTITILAAE
ncbi:flavodoxin [Acutalibacter sp. 1XD8-33]|uniref:flavodoxin n=1 Tax=Acutalibacter sp. 1XD8-33 TaxID=2320081 RepID=UPI001FA99C27|nr:flavodoxin [Acutalibacter sp. 1XD8-33]